MLSLDTPIEYVSGVGPKRAQQLANLGLMTVQQLLEWYPFRYIDLTQITPIGQLKVGQEATIKATVTQVKQIRSPRKRMIIIEAALQDSSGTISAVWYNQPYLIQRLPVDSEGIFHGQVAFRPKKIFQSPLVENAPKIIPVYHETIGLHSRWFNKIIGSLLKAITIPEFLPRSTRLDYRLITLPQALTYIHQPESQTQVKLARDRLSFDELLLILLKVLTDRQFLKTLSAPKMQVDVDKLRRLVASLPFNLTASQKKSAWQIILDLTKDQPMNRLLQGDVGSGKTVVGALAALVSHHSGYQTVWLAPTEILAHQHYQSLVKLLNPFGISVGLWTGSVKDKKTHQIWIGTHALLSDQAPLHDVGLVIVDEQHRFGVQQRAKLRRANNNLNQIPHFLSMTATPIPRTLALTIYGDLDISTITDLPPGRQKITTRVIPPGERASTYKLLRSQIDQGRQIYVVTPLIEEATTNPAKLLDIERKSAVKEYERLTKEVFPGYRIGLLHGKLRPKEKQKVMYQFKSQQLDILVATAVIEVGIDVPNASVMMIEDAERFGLAQLHQLRGRVGRGPHPAWCFLLAGLWSKLIARRLKAMQRLSSGFELAEIDLQLRGPGELVGIRQSGLPDLKMASLTDTILVEKVRTVASHLAQNIERYPEVAQKLAVAIGSRHLE